MYRRRLIARYRLVKPPMLTASAIGSPHDMGVMVFNTNYSQNFSPLFTLTSATIRHVADREVFLVGFGIFLALFVVLGNLLTIVVVYRTPELRTLPNMYIVSLAVADLFTGVSFPFNLAANLPIVEHFLNNSKYKCILRYGFLHLFLSESFLCILAIAVDRFIYVVYPLRYYIYVNPRRTGFTILASWCLSLLVGLCIVLTSVWSAHCKFFQVIPRAFYLGFFLPYMGAILVLTAYMYGRITKQALQQRRRVRSVDPSTCTMTFRYCAATFRSLRLFIVVYGVLVLCWTPIGVLAFVGYLKDVSSYATNIASCIGFLNSGLNFFVYAAMNKHFRKAFVEILRIRQRRCYPCVPS